MRFENVEWPAHIFFYSIQAEKATFNLTLSETNLNHAQCTHSAPIESYTMIRFVHSLKCVSNWKAPMDVKKRGQKWSSELDSIEMSLSFHDTVLAVLVGHTNFT